MKFASLILSLMLPCTTVMAQSNVVINEVMQSNIDNLMVDNDYPDSWVELYNPTDKAVSLDGWYFGEKANTSKAWKLPAGSSIPAKGHFLIYCDKEAKGVHTDFRVDAGNAKLYLMNQSGTVVDSLFMVEQPAPNTAYGRKTDGAEEWQYEFTPTAGKPNSGAGIADAENILPAPVFSVPGGCYSEAQTVVITMPEGTPEDAFLIYTKDGSEPTLQNRAGVPAPRLNISVNSTTVIRAKIITRSSSALEGRSVTQSYIFHPREVTMPVISLTSDRANFYDAKIGILTANVNDGKPNYMQKWRRPVNVEYYDAEGTKVFNQLGETGVSGVSTREQPQKSMKIYTNKRFGKKNFKGDFWEDKPGVNKIKSFVIRSGGNNSFKARINDALLQKLFGTHTDEEDLDWQAYQPVIVYLNGTYLGEFGMRERSDENYVESNYGGLEDIEMADEALLQKPESGTLFEQFWNSYRDPEVTYEQMDAQMDMNNFVKYTIAQIWGTNTDFPTNNVSLWRPLEDGEKWRWIIKDMDRFAMMQNQYPIDFNMFPYLFEPSDITYGGIYNFDIWKTMNRFPEFRNKLVETFAIYLGDFLRADVVDALMDSLDKQIETEIQPTFQSYNVKFSEFTEANKWMKRVIFGEAATNIPGHSDLLYKQMSDFYQMGESCNLTVEKNDTLNLRLNDVALTEGNFKGKYFLSHPLRLSTGNENHGWRITVAHADGTVGEDTINIEQCDTTITLSNYTTTLTDTVRIVSYQYKGTKPDPDPDPDPEPFEGIAITYPTEGMLWDKITDGGHMASFYNSKHYAQVTIDIDDDDPDYNDTYKIATRMLDDIDIALTDLDAHSVKSATPDKKPVYFFKGHTYTMTIKGYENYWDVPTGKYSDIATVKFIGNGIEAEVLSDIKLVTVTPAAGDTIYSEEETSISIEFDGAVAEVSAMTPGGNTGNPTYYTAEKQDEDGKLWTIPLGKVAVSSEDGNQGTLEVRITGKDTDGHTLNLSKSADRAYVGSYTVLKGSDPKASIHDLNADEVLVGKFIKDGRVVILKNGIKYNAAGQTIK